MKSNKNILAVDDFSMNLMLIKETLTDIADIYTAKSPKAAITILEEAEVIFDLFLLDIEMPDMSGLELMRYIRKETGYKETPIIIISSNAKATTVTEAAALGVAGYVAKPFSQNILRSKVQKALGLTE